ncbi:MAG: DUF563 domain-containing protein [Selenomonadaceae bacterium]|nr:DUF563 domain-containing protein [Selenomonadaceae bacterium]
MTNLDYLYKPEAAKRFFNFSRFVNKKLGFQIIEHGTILPHRDKNYKGERGQVGFGGIVDAEGRFIRESHIHTGTGGAYEPPLESIQHSSETVIYLGISFHIWGHAITDNLRRVWFLKSEFMKQFKNCPVVYIAHDFTFNELKNVKRLLEILEVNVDNLREIKQPTQFDKIILPDECFFSKTLPPDDYSFPDNDSLERKFTNEYRQMIDQVRNFAMKNRTYTSSKKIYYFYGIRRQIGEERLAEYFKSKGYEIISPEKLTLDEQLNLLINAESFASTLGSCSHNSVFLRDNVEAILIPRRNEYMFHQEALNQVHPINVNYVDSSLSIFYEVVGVYQHVMHCFIISKQLKQFFGDKWNGYEEADFKIFMDYFKSCAKQGIPLNSEAEKYYGSILPDFIKTLFQKQTYAINYPDMFPHWEKFRPLISYQTHISRKGWNTSWIQENQTSNELNQKFYIQAIKVNALRYKVYYAVYYNEVEGWSEKVKAPEQAGTTGKRKPIYGMKVWLDEAGTKEFDILYRMHKFDDTWTAWAKNGEELVSQMVKLDAIQIKLEPRAINLLPQG